MAKATNRYFHFLAAGKNVRPSSRLWYPSADVYSTLEGWLVKVELAGVSTEDLEIDIQGNVLNISGTRRDTTCSHGISYHQMEITYSSFEKTLEFPATIDGARIEHNFDNGLLIIHLLKSRNNTETEELETRE